MLDCMISELTCKEDLLDFFDKLEKISGEHNLASTINELRQGALCIYDTCDINFYIIIASQVHKYNLMPTYLLVD